MENVRVYMLNNETSGGLNYSAGQIYTVETHVAEEMEQNGLARQVSYRQLDVVDDKIRLAMDELQAELDKIDANRMLSDEGKAVKKRELLETTKEQIGEFGKQFTQELARLKQDAQRNATKMERKKDYDADKINENVGLVVSEVAMSLTFTDGLEAVQSQLDFMDQDTARRLMSQFTEIKKVLDEKGAHIRGADRYVQDLYKNVKEVATNESQARASVEYRILQKIETERNRRGHYPTNFQFIEKRVLKQ